MVLIEGATFGEYGNVRFIQLSSLLYLLNHYTYINNSIIHSEHPRINTHERYRKTRRNIIKEEIIEKEGSTPKQHNPSCPVHPNPN
jgi:hypothetical protein